MKSPTERTAALRTRMRARGYILRTVWVHPNDWERHKAYTARMRADRDALMRKRGNQA